VLIAGGRLIDPSVGIDALRDVRMRDGVVAEIGERLAPREGEAIYDARNACVAPGFIDKHVHLRDPGHPHKETLESGARAAGRGGFTAVACMPNTEPALDSARRIEELAARARRIGECRIYPIAAISRARLGLETLDYAALARAGAVAFSDDGATVADAALLRAAAVAARHVAGRFISHAEVAALKGDGVMHEGDVSRELGLPGSPREAEDTIVARDLAIAAQTGKAWHIAHLSTRGAAALVARAKADGVDATCEVTPHHLLFDDASVRDLGAGAKVNPPLRTQDDARALREAVRDGTIDAFATDHAPHASAEKRGDIHAAAVGFTGLEIAVGAYALALPELPLLRFVALLSTNPARILGIAGGTLAVGAPADVTIFDDRPWRVDPSGFASKGTSTPFAGKTLPRRAVATFVGGVRV
jgi:dihydroorotase